MINLGTSFQETKTCQFINLSANLNSTSMIVKWNDYPRDCSIKKYKVTAKHLYFKACPGRSLKIPVTTKIVTTTITEASFVELEAYSTYNVSIEGETSKGQIISSHLKGETLSDRPKLKPSKGTANPLVRAIHFGWENQPISFDEHSCRLQRGEKGRDKYFPKKLKTIP